MFFEGEEAIRSLAHTLWVSEGHPDGRALDHWLAAQREHLAVDVSVPWFDAATAGEEADWMRRILWAPQPFAALV